jgi:hypothetical protein
VEAEVRNIHLQIVRPDGVARHVAHQVEFEAVFLAERAL